MTCVHIDWITAILCYIYIFKYLILKTKGFGPLNSIQKKPRMKNLIRNYEQIWDYLSNLYIYAWNTPIWIFDPNLKSFVKQIFIQKVIPLLL